ncbi:hypothetical protein CFB89_22830 [Burkholderia sp. AU16741]|uniref:cytochrome P450 n=1 Tax=Burkholderia sp. AU16741 TaxID=2015347 RepID=UPI000B7AB812|nr:cytochrome P450 [Burkholderia sp. AU16741]OXI30062.1 hypothetical protein CFB89_22830 [Burkholderia sp. AU16741]
MTPIFDETLAHKTLFELLTDAADDRDAFYDAMPALPGAYRDVSGTWMVGRYRLACAVLDHPALTTRSPLVECDVVRDEAGLLDTMLFADDSMHERMRKTFAPLFAKPRLAALRTHLASDLDALLEQVPDPRRFDLVEHLAQRLPALAACRLLGIDPVHAPRLQAQSMGPIRLISAMPIGPADHALAVAQTRRFVDELDVHLDTVCAVLQAGGTRPALARRQLLANVLLTFIAGYGTTMLSLGNTFAQALTRRDLWQALVQAPRHVPLALRELMRIEPAVHVMIRFARADVELDGLRMAKGDVVAVVAAAANRDPDAFAAPSDIRLDRAHGGLVFGAGSHGCLGAALARMQLAVVFETLLARMPGLMLEPGAHPRLQEGAFRGYRSLRVYDAARA